MFENCCDISCDLLFKATGRTSGISLTGFDLGFFSNNFAGIGYGAYTQEEQDRKYRYWDQRREVNRVEDNVGTIPDNTLDIDFTNRSQRIGFMACSSSSTTFTVSASGTGTQVDYTVSQWTDCSAVEHDYWRKKEEYDYTLTYELNYGQFDMEMTTDKDTTNRIKETYNSAVFPAYTCAEREVIDPVISTTYSSPYSGVGFLPAGGYDDPVRISASIFKQEENENAGGALSGQLTQTLVDWIDYDYVLSLYNEVLDQLEECQVTETVFSQGNVRTADVEDGTEYGVCGGKTVGTSEEWISRYDVQFDESYADKDHGVTSVSVTERSSFDLVLRLHEKSGKPDTLRVVGEIVHASQDDPVVETVTTFDEELTLVGAEVSMDSGSNKAWNYGTPTAFSSFLAPPTQGGFYYLRKIKYQLVEGGFFKSDH